VYSAFILPLLQVLLEALRGGSSAGLRWIFASLARYLFPLF
jgi:hypothetical protein